jgi:hypothetical protein
MAFLSNFFVDGVPSLRRGGLFYLPTWADRISDNLALCVFIQYEAGMLWLSNLGLGPSATIHAADRFFLQPERLRITCSPSTILRPHPHLEEVLCNVLRADIDAAIGGISGRISAEGIGDQHSLVNPRSSDFPITRRVKTRVNPGTSHSIFDTYDDDNEGASFDAKMVRDRDNNLVLVRSKRASEWLNFQTVFQRAMSPKKRQVIFGDDTSYDQESVRQRLAPFLRPDDTVSHSDSEVSTLFQYHRLQSMSAVSNSDKFKSSLLCLFRHDDWSVLSLVDFHECPPTQPVVFRGLDRATRLFLRECLRGYMLFLTVFFDSRYTHLWTRTLSWLESIQSGGILLFDGEFLRARLESAICDFWTEVRYGESESTLSPGHSYGRAEDIFKVWESVEDTMFSRIARDPYPHCIFFDGGEYARLKRSSEKTASLSPGQKSDPNLHICPFHLGHLLKVTSSEGSLMGPCRFQQGCHAPHVDLSTLTISQAISSAVVGVKSSGLTSSLTSAIQSNTGAFRQ